MLGIKSVSRAQVFEMIREGRVRVYIQLTVSGYETEVWADHPGPPLEDRVRELIGHGRLVIDRRTDGSRYAMKLAGHIS